MHASQAKAITKKASSLNDIYKNIKLWAEQGCTEITVPHPITDNDLNALSDNNYSIYRCDGKTVISWKE